MPTNSVTSKTASRANAKTARGKARSRAAAAVVAPSPAGPLPGTLGPSFLSSFAASPATAKRFVADLLVAGRPIDDRAAQAGELVHWASVSATAEQRHTLVEAFKESNAELLMVHEMSALPREQLAPFMKDYLGGGGNLSAVIEWVRIVGAYLRQPPAGGATRSAARARRPAAAATSRGWFDDMTDAVGRWCKKAGNAAGDAVDSVVNAVFDAGKTLGQAIDAAVGWTVDQVADLVEGLLHAGKKVADVLAAAATKGVTQLQKYVEAVLAAGRAVGEVVSWAAGQVAATANAVVAKLIQLGRKVLDIVEPVVTAGVTALTKIVEAVLAAGKKLGDIFTAFAAEALSVLRPLMQALLAAGQTLRALLVEAVKLAVTACRTVVQALLDLGRTLTQLLVEAAAAAADTAKTIVQALLALGYGLTKILVAVAAEAASVVKAVVQALLQLGQTVADVVLAAVGQTVAVATAVFRALVAAGQTVADILLTLAGRAVSALRTAVDALLAMGVTLAELVRDIVNKVGAAFRRGFFDGLVAIGKSMFEILKAAVEVTASVALLAFGVILEMCGGYRGLFPKERSQAEKIFGSSIDLDRVQLGFADLPGKILDYVNLEVPRAFTTMYLLNFGPGAVVDMQTIIHELTHVWQGVQMGPIYMTRALEAQMGARIESLYHTGDFSDDSAAYAVTVDALRANAGDLGKFNPEQQASIVEDFWIQTAGDGDTDLPSADLLAPYARKVWKPITGRGAPALRSKRAAAGAAARANIS